MRGKKGVPHKDPEDPPRRRANKVRGHGTWDNDRPPVCGVVGRESGKLRLTVAEPHLEARFGGNPHWHDICGVPVGIETVLAAQRKAVLIGARNAQIGCDVFRRFWHRFDTVKGCDPVIDEPPTDRAVLQAGCAGKGRLGLGHDKRRARH